MISYARINDARERVIPISDRSFPRCSGFFREPGRTCSCVYHRGKSGLSRELSGQAVLSDPKRLPYTSRDLSWAVGCADVLVGPGWPDAEGTQSPGGYR